MLAQGHRGANQRLAGHAVSRTEDRFETAREVLSSHRWSDARTRVAVLLGAWRRAAQGLGRAAGAPANPDRQVAVDARPSPAHREDLTPCSAINAPPTMSIGPAPFMKRIEALASFTREDTTDERLDKLERLLGTDTAQLAETAALFATLLSLPADRYPPLRLPPQRRLERTLEALAAQVDMLTRQRPVFIVFEDVHWIDPTRQRRWTSGCPGSRHPGPFRHSHLAGP